MAKHSQKNPSPDPTDPPRRIGLKEIARAADVSVSSVSMALADHPEIGVETKRRIRQISNELGYRPKEKVKNKVKADDSVARVGFMILGEDLKNPTNISILESLMGECASAGVALQLASAESRNGLEAAREQTLSLVRGVDGMLLMGLVDRTLLNDLNNEGIPCVMLGYSMTNPRQSLETRVHTVGSDEIGMGQLATESLITRGHRRIAFVCEVVPEGLSHWRWRAGYAAAHVHAGLPVVAELMHVTGKMHDDMESAADAMLALNPRPTAFVIPDARIASIFLTVMRRRGVQIPVESIVIASDPALVDRYGMASYPRIEYNLSAYATVGLRVLRQLARDPNLTATTVLVPFGFQNLG